MPADRFFLNSDLKAKAIVLLEGQEHHHLAHVMRFNEGEVVELVNGRGDLATGKIGEIGKKNVAIELESVSRKEEISSRIYLGVPFMRPSKLEWIVEKGTELGVSAFLFYPAKYSEKI